MKTSIITAAVAIIAIKILPSCATSTEPDGSTTTTIDGNAWMEIVRMIASDEVPKAKLIPSK